MRKGWTYKKLGDFIDEYSVRDKGKCYPVYSVTNSKGFCQEFFGKNVASEDTSNYKIVPRGYFAYNPSRINVGSVAWQNEEENVSVSPLYVVFSVSPELSQDYLLYYIKSNYAMTYINALARGAVRNNLRLSTLKSFDIPFASIGEQQKIVYELDLLCGVIEKQKAQIEELDKLAQSIFYDMFGDPVTNEKGWEIKKLKDCCKNYDSQRKPITAKDRIKGNIPYYGASGVVDYVKDFIFDGDFLLVSEDGANLVLRSTPIAFCIKGKTWVNNHAHILKFDTLFQQKYIEFSINLRDISMMVTGCAQPKLTQAALNNMIIPYPPLSLQQEFAAKIEAIEAMKAKVRQSLKESEQLFNSRMDYYFN